MKACRMPLLVAAIVLVGLLVTTNAFAITKVFSALGPNAVDISTAIPQTAIRVDNLNQSNPVKFGKDHQYGYISGTIEPGGKIFDIIQLGDGTPGDATFSVKMARTPLSLWPSDYFAIRWTNSATPGTYDIFTDRRYSSAPDFAVPASKIGTVFPGLITDTLATADNPIHPVLGTDIPLYEFGIVYIPTTSTKGVIELRIESPKPNAPHTILVNDNAGDRTNGAGVFNQLLGWRRYDDPWTGTGARNGPNPTSPTNPGITWSTGGTDVSIKFLAELRHSSAVAADTFSFVDTVTLPDPTVDNGSFAVSGAPANLFWAESGPRATMTVTYTNSGNRFWAVNTVRLREVGLDGNGTGLARAAWGNGVAGTHRFYWMSGPVLKTADLTPAQTPPLGTSQVWPLQVDAGGTAPFVIAAMHTPRLETGMTYPTKRWTMTFNLQKDARMRLGRDPFGQANWLRFPSTVDAVSRPTVDIDVARFFDVTLTGATGNHRRHIEDIATAGVTAGVTVDPPTFVPSLTVSRRQMAAFLGRSMRAFVPGMTTFNPGTPPTYLPPTATFTDVPLTAPQATWIYAIADPVAAGAPAGTLPVTVGCTATEYCPDIDVTRDQMAAFLQRAFQIPLLNPAAASFTDVPTTNPFFRPIESIASLTLVPYPITRGCTATTYCPTQSVTREQMVTFLFRAGIKTYPEPPAQSTVP